jgi:hypothetical protein
VLFVICFPSCEGQKLKFVMKTLRHSVFFSDLIVLTVESYFEFLIGGYLTLKQPYPEEFGDKLSLLYAGIAGALALGFLPMILCKI